LVEKLQTVYRIASKFWLQINYKAFVTKNGETQQSSSKWAFS